MWWHLAFFVFNTSFSYPKSEDTWLLLLLYPFPVGSSAQALWAARGQGVGRARTRAVCPWARAREGGGSWMPWRHQAARPAGRDPSATTRPADRGGLVGKRNWGRRRRLWQRQGQAWWRRHRRPDPPLSAPWQLALFPQRECRRAARGERAGGPAGSVSSPRPPMGGRDPHRPFSLPSSFIPFFPAPHPQSASCRCQMSLRTHSHTHVIYKWKDWPGEMWAHLFPLWIGVVMRNRGPGREDWRGDLNPFPEGAAGRTRPSAFHLEVSCQGTFFWMCRSLELGTG